MPKIIDDSENPRCQTVFRCYGFHIADPDFTGCVHIKTSDKPRAQEIVDKMLRARSLKTYNEWIYTIVKVGEITPPEKL